MPAYNLAQALKLIESLGSKSKTARVLEYLQRERGIQPVQGSWAPSEGYLTQLSTKLHASGGDLASLDERGRKFALYLLWGDVPPWKPSERDVDRWLAIVGDAPTRRTSSRIGRALVRNGRPGTTTDAIRRWIKANVAKETWRSPLSDLETNWVALSGNGPYNLAERMIARDESLFDEIDANPRLRNLLTGSAMVAETLRAYADWHVHWKADAPRMWERSSIMIGKSGIGSSNPVHGEAASVAMVSAIVKWKETHHGEAATKKALAHVLAIAGDPRLEPGRWSRIDPGVKSTVERWLMERDFEALFEVIDKLADERDIETWTHRREYWLKYHKSGDVKRQWIMFGKMAQSLADKLGVSYGRLKSSEPVHCGLLMELSDGTIVLEMNVNGSARLWKPNSSSPRFHQDEYVYSAIVAAGGHSLSHRAGWQGHFDYAISAFRQ